MKNIDIGVILDKVIDLKKFIIKKNFFFNL
jgi:hypothetical protein